MVCKRWGRNGNSKTLNVHPKFLMLFKMASYHLRHFYSYFLLKIQLSRLEGLSIHPGTNLTSDYYYFCLFFHLLLFKYFLKCNIYT